METPNQPDIHHHAIQVSLLGVRKLHIEVLQAPSPDIAGPSNCTLTVGRSDYDEDQNTIFVVVGANLPKPESPESKQPFWFDVELGALFKVDPARFPMDELEHWADNNAVFILYPYLREHVFALTARSGFMPMLLPLLEIPVPVPSKHRDEENDAAE